MVKLASCIAKIMIIKVGVLAPGITKCYKKWKETLFWKCSSGEWKREKLNNLHKFFFKSVVVIPKGSRVDLQQPADAVSIQNSFILILDS